MYAIGDYPIFKVIADYKDADNAEKRNIIQTFCTHLWSRPIKRRTRTVTISYVTSETVAPQFYKLFR